ncbi:ornithine cyclodeaminase family protein [Bacillus cytotoxicus]|nr:MULTISPECIES: ornithine cyclodeaminase family protein [Bacillus cereus group]QTR69469.1 ornithine cyclodeaminase family protein [Bacillus cytotoxicus]QTR82009.1 ornithine cyclodeaminase family protein [Bacillus cytotoxicus]QTR85747.1 ornithine cyclodeaminase family protein [Bacillus cytotoxicus]HDR4572500.1 ornithine cyclodeaminase family protein [Bacillus cytotoxicus]HDR4588332.1 ornithine cyclodeaminase family protein [Bacillus cytotoxicus]
MIHIIEEMVKEIYKMKDCLQDVERAFQYYMNNEIATPVRLNIQHSQEEANSLYMPSYVAPIEFASTKIVSVFPKNTQKGKKALQSLIVLTETNTGDHVATIEASYLTTLRTGAMSGIATKHFARQNANVCVVIGCGAQALGQIQAVMEVRPVTRILLVNRTMQKAFEFKNILLSLYPNWSGSIEIMESANDAVAIADIVICSTTSTTPVLNGNYLKPGTHINGIGSYQPHMQELDVTTLQRSDKIIVDTIEGVQHEAGDFLIASKQNEWDFSNIYSELGDIIIGKKQGRANPNEITLFKSVGVAFLDTVVAASIYEKYREIVNI